MNKIASAPTLFEDYPGRRPADLAALDGVPFRAAKQLPHPVELTRWHEAGFYYMDLDNSCFRLTQAGRMASAGGIGA